MKASNIILLSIFLSVIVGATSLLFVGIYEVKNIGKHENIHKQTMETQTLNTFNTLIILGNGKIRLEKNDSANYIYKSNKDTVTQKQDTLIINVNMANSKIYYTNIKNIKISDNARVRFDVFEGDTANIDVTENSNLRINRFKLNQLNAKIKGNASIRIENIDDEIEKASAKFSISDNSQLRIQNSDNLKIEIDKSGNASCRIY